MRKDWFGIWGNGGEKGKDRLEKRVSKMENLLENIRVSVYNKNRRWRHVKIMQYYGNGYKLQDNSVEDTG